MLQAEYSSSLGEVIILGLPAFVKMKAWNTYENGALYIHKISTTFYKTSPVTKIYPNGDFETKNGFLCKRT